MSKNCLIKYTEKNFSELEALKTAISGQRIKKIKVFRGGGLC